jgi:hypothetical protein
MVLLTKHRLITIFRDDLTLAGREPMGLPRDMSMSHGVYNGHDEIAVRRSGTTGCHAAPHRINPLAPVVNEGEGDAK